MCVSSSQPVPKIISHLDVDFGNEKRTSQQSGTAMLTSAKSSPPARGRRGAIRGEGGRWPPKEKDGGGVAGGDTQVNTSTRTG